MKSQKKHWRKSKFGRRFLAGRGHYFPMKHRQLFQQLDKKPYEVGGYIDFNKKGFERADLFVGNRASVDIDVSPDKEVDYHTHPKTGNKFLDRLNMFPSKGDLKMSKSFPSQAMMIFHDGKVMMISKNKNFKIHNKIVNNIEEGLRKDVAQMNQRQLFNKHGKEYTKLGLKMKLIEHNKGFKIPIKVKE